jgi:hypothetical protein
MPLWGIKHHTIKAPQPHPPAGEFFSPPVGGDLDITIIDIN